MEIGGRLLELNGMEFYMYSREKGKHKLPHIHVKYQGDEVVISLDGKILEGKIKSKVQSLAQEIIKSDKESFLIKWNNLTDGEKFRFINKELIRVDSSGAGDAFFSKTLREYAYTKVVDTAFVTQTFELANKASRDVLLQVGSRIKK